MVIYTYLVRFQLSTVFRDVVVMAVVVGLARLGGLDVRGSVPTHTC